MMMKAATTNVWTAFADKTLMRGYLPLDGICHSLSPADESIDVLAVLLVEVGLELGKLHVPTCMCPQVLLHAIICLRSQQTLFLCGFAHAVESPASQLAAML